MIGSTFFIVIEVCFVWFLINSTVFLFISAFILFISLRILVIMEDYYIIPTLHCIHKPDLRTCL